MASESHSKSFKVNKAVIEKFCSITGAEENVAKNMLEICNGNLEVAINMHWDCEGDTNTASRAATSSNNDDDVRPPIPPTRGVLVESLPFGVRSRQTVPRSIFDGFRDFQAEARWQEENLSSPENKVSRKRKTLEDLFRPPLDLMHRSSLESARELGCNTNRWLMVNIQNVQEFACQVLNRDVWSNSAVKNIVSEHFVFWQVYCESEEGQRYIQFYTVNEYPYIAILDPRTGEKLVVWNKMDSLSFCDLVTEFLSSHPSPDGSNPTKKYKMEESITDKTEEQQIKAAIEASLCETVTKLSGKFSERSDNEDDDNSDVETFESDSESSLLNECSKKLPDTSADSKSKSTNETTDNSWETFLGDEKDPKSELVIRFPDGQRQQITFPCSSQLQALVLYVVSLGYPANKYELVTNFPRRQLCSLSMNQTLKEAGLFPRETIFIQLKAD